jgi:hypothetical protein
MRAVPRSNLPRPFGWPHSSLGSSAQLGLALVLILALGHAESAEARKCKFCSGAVSRACGKHLEPACTSGSKCDSGYQNWDGDPFPVDIDCPWPTKDTTVDSGCYSTDKLTCADCGGQAEAACWAS